MRRFLLAVAVFLAASVCCGQDRYRNSEYHFSLEVPWGWDLITEEFDLTSYPETHKLRFEDEIVAICRETGDSDKRSSMLVQARVIGDESAGISLEEMLEERLSSNEYRPYTLSYVNDFEKDLIDRGLAAKKPESKFIVWCKRDVHVYHETVVVPLIEGGTTGISTIRVLGNNRVVTLTFELHGEDIEGPCSLVEEVASSVTFDKNYGFGETTPLSIFRTLWFWLFPGAGVLIVAFLVYKWVASEYG